MRKVEERQRGIHLSNLTKFYSRQDDEVVRRMVEVHRARIAEFMEAKDSRMVYVHKCHLEAVKKVLLSRQ